MISTSLIRSFAADTLHMFYAPTHICSITYIFIISKTPTVIWLGLFVFYAVTTHKRDMIEPRPAPDQNSKQIEDSSAEFEGLLDFPPCPTTVPQINLDAYPEGYWCHFIRSRHDQSVLKSEKGARDNFTTKKSSRGQFEKDRPSLPSCVALDDHGLQIKTIDCLGPKDKTIASEKKKDYSSVRVEDTKTASATNASANNQSSRTKSRNKVWVKKSPLEKQSLFGMDLEELLLMQPSSPIPLKHSISYPGHLFKNRLHRAANRMRSHPLGDASRMLSKPTRLQKSCSYVSHPVSHDMVSPKPSIPNRMHAHLKEMINKL